MLDLVSKNKEMLASKSYKLSDERDMLRIDSLDKVNDYDLYLIACCLCNYPIDEKSEARELRMKYFKATNNGSLEGFEHPVTDYKKTVTSVKCTNTGNVNKYGLYEYEININDKDLVSDFWAFKAKNCLKYVDSKTYKDKIVVSISRDQLNNFTSLLDKYMIDYDIDDIESGLFYKNKSVNKLVDISNLTLPFTPYPYQIEDANKIIRKKRLLLGHEMGCISGDAIVEVLHNNVVKTITLFELYNLYKYDQNIKIKSYVDNYFDFMPIKNVLYNGKKSVMQVNTKNTSIKCTPDHEILTINGWIEAQKLKVNDTILSNYSDDQTEVIYNISTIINEEDVYDIAIDDYFVSNFIVNNIVVHNCGKTFISILVGESIGTNTDVMYSTLDELNYNDIVITNKGPLPIGKIVEENIDCKVKVVKNGITKFVNILDRRCSET